MTWRERLKKWRGLPIRGDFLTLLPQGGVGAELGVFRGEFTAELLRVAEPKELHLIDVWWTAFGEHFPDWGAYTDHGRLSTRQAYREVQAQVARHPRVRSQIHVGSDLDILQQFPNKYFDWVYVDSSHTYEHTLAELEILRHKVHGLILGHDWADGPPTADNGVAQAVQEFCTRYGYSLVQRDKHYRQWAIKKDPVG